jgi:hypothetical protein
MTRALSASIATVSPVPSTKSQLDVWRGHLIGELCAGVVAELREFKLRHLRAG